MTNKSTYQRSITSGAVGIGLVFASALAWLYLDAAVALLLAGVGQLFLIAGAVGMVLAPALDRLEGTAPADAKPAAGPSAPPPSSREPGYHPDPEDPTRLRWWDGYEWGATTMPKDAADAEA